MEIEHCVQGDGGEIRNFLHGKKLLTKDGLMTWKAMQKVMELQNVWQKGDKEDNGTLIILYEDFAQGTCIENPNNI